MALAVHAERVAGDPQAVRWVVPPGRVPVGKVRRAPGRLGELFDNGVLTAGLVEHSAVWLWLAPGESWSVHGRAVRAALLDALADGDDGDDGIAEAQRWTIDPAPGEVLARVTADLLDGTVGDFVRSHGGSVSAEQTGEDTVAVQLGGACEHCAAAEFTLRQRLMGELRRRCPDLVEIGKTDRRLMLSLRG